MNNCFRNLIIGLVFNLYAGVSYNTYGQVYSKLLQENKPVFLSDTLFYPFYDGIQMIEIDHASAWQAEVNWHELRQPRALSWSSLIPAPPPNVYLFRDNTGNITKAFNSKASIARLNADFKTIPLYPLQKKRLNDPPCHICHTLPGGSAAYYYPGQWKKREGFYFVYGSSTTNHTSKPHTKKNDVPVGMIDSLGNLIFPVAYQYIEKFGPNFLVKKNNLFGMIDQESRPILPLAYEAASTRNEHVIVFTKNKKISCIYDVKNKSIKNLNDYDWIDENRLDDFELEKNGGLVQVRKNGKTGLVDKNHEQVVPPIYDYASPVFREGMLRVTLNKKWGFLDTKGKEVIHCIYDDATDYSEGHATVIRNRSKACINIKGEETSGCNYTWSEWEKDEELGDRGTYIKGRQVLKRGYLYGIANKNGRLIVPLIYETILGIRIYGRDILYHQEFYKVRKQGKWGVIDKNGKEILPCIYDKVDDYKGESGLVSVEKNEQTGLLDMSFKWVVPCRYEELRPVKPQVKIWFGEKGLWGLMDTDLQVLITPQD